MRFFPLTVFLIGLLVIESCTPLSNTYYFIENRTDKDIEVTEYRVVANSVVIQVPKDTTILYLAYEQDPGDGPDGPPFNSADSVVCEFANGRSLVFYPDSSPLKSGRNLYNLNDYQGGKKRRREYEYTFVFEEEDLPTNGNAGD